MGFYTEMELLMMHMPDTSDTENRAVSKQRGNYKYAEGETSRIVSSDKLWTKRKEKDHKSRQTAQLKVIELHDSFPKEINVRMTFFSRQYWQLLVIWVNFLCPIQTNHQTRR